MPFPCWASLSTFWLVCPNDSCPVFGATRGPTEAFLGSTKHYGSKHNYRNKEETFYQDTEWKENISIVFRLLFLLSKDT